MLSMKNAFLLFLLIVIGTVQSQPITAILTVVQYDPFVFQLKFSEAVTQPAFQLLLNNLYPLNYTFITTDTTADTFYFQVSPFQYPPGENL